MENNRSENTFIKLFVSDYLEGLLAALGPENTQTLIALSLFLPNPRPSQKFIAKVLGVSIASANKRIKDLERFRFNNKPVIKVYRSFGSSGRFQCNEYEILLESGIKMFDDSSRYESNVI